MHYNPESHDLGIILGSARSPNGMADSLRKFKGQRNVPEYTVLRQILFLDPKGPHTT